MRYLLYITILLFSSTLFSHPKCDYLELPAEISKSDLKAMLTLIPPDELGVLYSIDFLSFDYPESKYKTVRAKVFERGIPKSEWKIDKEFVLQTSTSSFEQMKSGIRLNFSEDMQYVISKQHKVWKLEDTIQYFSGIDWKKSDEPECKNSPNQSLKKDENQESLAF